MDDGLNENYWIPEHVRAHVRGLGRRLPLQDTEGRIRTCDDWMASRGDFHVLSSGILDGS